MEDDTHRKFMRLVQEYWKVNQQWETRQTHTAGMEARRLLSEIRDLAIIRREEIQQVRAQKPKVKSPKYKKAQILKAQGDADAT
jgi:hypothetical protein